MKTKPKQKTKAGGAVPAKKPTLPEILEANDVQYERLRLEAMEKLSSGPESTAERLSRAGRNPTVAELAQLAATLALRKGGPSLLSPLILREKHQLNARVHTLAAEALNLWEACSYAVSQLIENEALDLKESSLEEVDVENEGAQNIINAARGLDEKALAQFGPYPISFERALRLIMGERVPACSRADVIREALWFATNRKGDCLPASDPDEYIRQLQLGVSWEHLLGLEYRYRGWQKETEAERKRDQGRKNAQKRWGKSVGRQKEEKS